MTFILHGLVSTIFLTDGLSYNHEHDLMYSHSFQSYDPDSEEFDVPPNKARSELAYAKVSEFETNHMMNHILLKIKHRNSKILII